MIRRWLLNLIVPDRALHRLVFVKYTNAEQRRMVDNVIREHYIGPIREQLNARNLLWERWIGDE